jgi:NAD(P)-dependent dehydrogenase (short-subunit alcohol dehydrogenase family)
MKIELTGRVAFVTGGSKGIGKAVAEVLAACAANVGIIARGRDELEDTAAAINARQAGRALALQGDVSRYEDLGDAIRRTAREFGGLHLAVNNAGVAGRPGLLRQTGRENWRQVMGINLDGVAFATAVQERARDSQDRPSAPVRDASRWEGKSCPTTARAVVKLSYTAHALPAGFPISIARVGLPGR